jgi:hypothetical protein
MAENQQAMSPGADDDDAHLSVPSKVLRAIDGIKDSCNMDGGVGIPFSFRPH